MQTNSAIKDIGLKRHLEETKADHNGLGYDDFVKLLEVARHPSGKVNKMAIVRAFGVEKRSVRKWLEHYEKEQLNG